MASAEFPISLDLRIETPENARLTCQVAGPTWRGLAYLIDSFFRFAIFVLGLMLALLLSLSFAGISSGLVLLLLFVLEWGYFAGCEYFWQGRTPGKWACGLRVVHESGEPLSWWGAVLRNLLRVADTLPLMLVFPDQSALLAVTPIYGPALISMLLTTRLQRLGDLAAGTIVIHEVKPTLDPPPIILNKIEPLPRGELSGFRPSRRTLAVIDRFLARRPAVTHRRGHLMAAPLARELAEKLSHGAELSQYAKFPMAYLAQVHVTFTPRTEPIEPKDRSRNMAASGAQGAARQPSLARLSPARSAATQAIAEPEFLEFAEAVPSATSVAPSEVLDFLEVVDSPTPRDDGPPSAGGGTR